METAKAQALSQVNENDEIPEGKGKEVAKAVIKDVPLTATVKEGVFDGGAAVVLEGDKFNSVMGGRIADGEQLASDLKSIFEEVKGKSRSPCDQVRCLNRRYYAPFRSCS
jgi:hypothetical protein